MNPDSPIEVDTAQDRQAKPTVACQRCRDHKLRCDRDLPSCMRCRKQSATCNYPPPPDRKLIAQRTSRLRASQSTTATAPTHARISSSPDRAPVAKRPRTSDGNGNNEQNVPQLRDTHLVNDSETADLPSTEIGLLLLEVYFKRIYFAPLLFHKSIAFQLYMQNKIPAYLLKAIFAHAAVFLKEIDAACKLHINILSMPTLFAKSWSWARSSSKEVLSHADDPSILHIQALQVLQFYYFSRGEARRAIIHASLAYRLSQLLGYDHLCEIAGSPATERRTRYERVDREIKRRCFWASWCSSCIGGRHLESFRICERAAGLPLPAQFEKGRSAQDVDLKLGLTMNADWTLSSESLSNQETENSPSISLMAELVRLVGIWNKAQAFMADSPSLSCSQRTEQLQNLVGLLNSLEKSLQLDPAKLETQAEAYGESPELVTCVHSLYHLNQLLVHASVVPALSGCTTESSSNLDSVRKYAEMVLQQAHALAELLQRFVAAGLDVTRLWPLTGYGAFVAGSVFIVYNNMMQLARSVDHTVSIPGPNSEQMKTLQMVLEILSQYWKPLQKIATDFDKAINSERSDDTGFIRLSAYPYNTRPNIHSPENHGGDLNGADHTSTLNVRLASAGQPVPHQSQHNLAHQPNFLQDGTTSEATTRTLETGYPPVSAEIHPLHSAQNSLSDMEWWNSAPALNVWDHLPFFNNVDLHDLAA